MHHADGYRRILHVDMDAFFASVEQRDRPKLRGLPVAVGHSEGRSVVAAASYEARRFGVHSAMPSARARSLCPDLVFVPGRMERYREVSAQVREIFSRYTARIEPISIDEAFLDVTDSVGVGTFAYALDIARAVKADIRVELGLTASAGVSYNKFLAKIASDWRKPDGLCCIHPSRAMQFLRPLPVEKLWGVGPSTAARMHALGWKTCGDLLAVPLSELLREFGKSGAVFWKFARGEDDRPVVTFRERKSVGCEHTYGHDLRSREAIEARLAEVAGDLSGRLARRNFSGATLTLKARFFDFRTVTRSRTRDRVWRADADDLLAGALPLLDLVPVPPGGVRLLGLSVGSPPLATGQGELFGGPGNQDSADSEGASPSLTPSKSE